MDDNPAAELARLQETVRFQERAIEQFHEQLLALQADLRALSRRCERLERLWEDANSGEPEIRDPRAERPPHY
jgi:uncharacterized coiled-coil protein SlyX